MKFFLFLGKMVLMFIDTKRIYILKACVGGNFHNFISSSAGWWRGEVYNKNGLAGKFLKNWFAMGTSIWHQRVNITKHFRLNSDNIPGECYFTTITSFWTLPLLTLLKTCLGTFSKNVVSTEAFSATLDDVSTF